MIGSVLSAFAFDTDGSVRLLVAGVERAATQVRRTSSVARTPPQVIAPDSLLEILLGGEILRGFCSIWSDIVFVVVV